MDASVVISTYTRERAEDIDRCLDSVAAQTRPPRETVLVLDPDPDLVEFYRPLVGGRARILVSPQRGLSAARNLGMESTRGEMIAFLDDDAFAEPDWLERLAEAFAEDDNILAVGGRIEAWWSDGKPSWWPSELDWIVGCTYDGHPAERADVRNAIGANMALRRAATKVVPEGFRTEVGRVGKYLLGGEEMEYCVKLRTRFPGARVLYEPAALVRHRVPASRARLSYLLRRAVGEGRSKRMIRATLPDPGTLATESAYARYLARRALRRLARPTPSSLLQIGALGIAVGAAAYGYLAPTGSRHARLAGKPSVSS